MEANYYKEYYHFERNHWWATARMSILKGLIAKQVNNKKDLKILNVGVATGATSLMLNHFGEVTSLEYDAACCKFLEEKVGIKPIQGSLLELPFEDESYDLVCCFDVVEHIEDDKLAVSELERVTKKGGVISCTVPAFMTLWSSHDVVNHHFRRYKLNSFVGLFNLDKVKIIKKSYFNFFLFIPIFSFRMIRKVLPERPKKENTSGSDFEVMEGKGIINKLLHHLFNFEKPILLSGINFPFGVSILAMFKKQ